MGAARYYDKITVLISPSGTSAASADDFDNCTLPLSPAPSPTTIIPSETSTEPTSTPAPTDAGMQPLSGCPNTTAHVSSIQCGAECVCSSWELIQSVSASASATTFMWRVCNTCKYDVSWQAICLDGLTYIPPRTSPHNAAAASGSNNTTLDTLCSNRCAYEVKQMDGRDNFPPCTSLVFKPTTPRCFGAVSDVNSAPANLLTADLVQFCTFAVEVRPGDVLRLRQLVQFVRTPTQPVDFDTFQFTYTLGNANDSSGDWRLEEFNTGADVTITLDDVTTIGNRGIGQFRIYVYNSATPTLMYHDTLLIRVNSLAGKSTLQAAQQACTVASLEKICDFIPVTVVTPSLSHRWSFYQHAGLGRWLDLNTVSLERCCAAIECASNSTNRTCARVGFTPPTCDSCVDLSDVSLSAWCVPNGDTLPAYNWVVYNNTEASPVAGVRPGDRDARGFQLDCDCTRIELPCGSSPCTNDTCVCDTRVGQCAANEVCLLAETSETCPQCPAVNGQMCGGRGACVCGVCACGSINSIRYTGPACELIDTPRSCYQLTGGCENCTSDMFLACAWCTFAAGTRCQRAGTCLGVTNVEGCSAGTIDPGQCPSQCSGHGECVLDINTNVSVCRCTKGWHGIDCGAPGGRGTARKAAVISVGVVCGIAVAGAVVLAAVVFGAKALVQFKHLLGMNPIETGGPAVRENVIYRDY